MAEKKFERKPFKNFFIKKKLQMSLIIRIVFAVMVATVICLGTLVAVYYFKFHSILLYQMNEVTLDLKKENILYLLLPSLLISLLVNFAMAVFIGLYASRKYAVPIFKLEQWAALLASGNLTAKINFRERTQMQELTQSCNAASETLRTRFAQIKKHVINLKELDKGESQVKEIEAILEELELEPSHPTAIDTAILEVEDTK
jgi:methyl-accepting chemotaxis protein